MQNGLPGKYSEEEKTIYNIVLEAQDKAIKECKVGNPFYITNTIATTVVSQRLQELGIIKSPHEIRRYFMHGTSHYLGLDVHDPGTGGDFQANTVITVEPGIGYASGHWARWKVFESYAIMHAFYGLDAVGTCKQDWYNVVIPNYFDLDEFEYAPEKKEDYFLFLGRVYGGKGIDIAIQVTEKIGAKLKIAGQNPENREFPDHVEFVGYADIPTRKRLMSRAKGSFVASMYVEPFGGVQVENLISGTPTITTDWGAFTENNPHGVTGYRCKTFDDFVQAALTVDKIDPKVCREHGLKFSLDNVAPMYEKFFQDVMNVYTGNGWYELSDETKSMLDKLKETE